MAWTSAFSGTSTIGTTEWSLSNNSSTIAAQTTKVTAQPWVDTTNIALGDEFELRLYEKVKSGGTQRLAGKWSIAGAQSEPAWTGPALMVGNGWDWTLKKIGGTDRSIDWEIRTL